MTMTHLLPALPPVRPRLLQDEWFETYLVRVIRENGVKAPWRYDLDRLREVLDQKSDCTENGAPKYANETLPSWAVPGRGAQIRYCPICFDESRHIRARWRLATFEACTLHKLILKSGLCEPAITSMYQEPGKRLVHEIQPDELWSDTTCPLPVAAEYANNIWSEFENRAAGVKPGDVAEPLAWALLAERIMDAVVTAVRDLGYPPRFVLRLHHRANWLANSGLRLIATKDGVWQFLASLKVHAHRRAALRTLLALQREEQRKKTIMSRLPLQEFHDKLLASFPETSSGSPSGALPRAMHPAGYISLERTEALLGCSPSFLFFLVREQFFHRVEKIKWGRKLYVFIHGADVEACRRWLASTMTYEQVLSQLCVDRKAYWILLECGLLNPIQLDSWSRHRREDVSKITTNLDSIARPYNPEIRGVQPLMGMWWQRKGAMRTAVIQVLKEIWDGQLPVFRNPEVSGLGAYYVDFSAIDRLRRLSESYAFRRAREGRSAGQFSLLDIS